MSLAHVRRCTQEHARETVRGWLWGDGAGQRLVRGWDDAGLIATFLHQIQHRYISLWSLFTRNNRIVLILWRDQSLVTSPSQSPLPIFMCWIDVRMSAESSLESGYKSFKVHSHNLLGVNYCWNDSLNNGLCCTKQEHLHLLFAIWSTFVWTEKLNNAHFYRPQGYVFTSICHSVHRESGRHPLQADPPLGRHPLPGRHPPRQTLLQADTSQETATAVDGMHPTGMHSSLRLHGLQSSRNSSHLINHRCEWTFR